MVGNSPCLKDPPIQIAKDEEGKEKKKLAQSHMEGHWGSEIEQ